MDFNWKPITDAPTDGTPVDLMDAKGEIAFGCYWGLCDVDYSPHGAYTWTMAPTDFKATHFRPAQARGPW